MDMREMVDKVKRNEPLYGTSTLTPYMQGVASRNSRYSGVFLHVIPWFNFVNHAQVRFDLKENTVQRLTISSTEWIQQNTTNKLKRSWKKSEKERMLEEISN